MIAPLVLGLLLAAPPAEKLLLQDLAAQGVAPADAAALGAATCRALAAQKGLELLCGDELRALIQWSQAAASLDACKDEACLGAAARGLDAASVVSGTVRKLAEGYALELALLDVKSAKIRARAEVKGATLEALHERLAGAVSALFSGSSSKSR